MWIVRTPHQVIDTDHVAGQNTCAIILESRKKLTAKIVTRSLSQLRFHPAPMVVPPMVHELHDRRDPADTALDHRPFELGKTHRRAAPDDAHYRVVHHELDHADVDAARTRAMRDAIRFAAAEMQ